MTIRSFVLTFLFTLSPSLYAIDDITTGQQLQRQAEQVTSIINTTELKTMIEAVPDMVLIDIRTHREISNMGGTISAPQNNIIQRGWLEFNTPRIALNKDTPIVVYCGAGIRSPLAAKTLQDMGYTNVKNYSAGFIGWKNEGLPIK